MPANYAIGIDLGTTNSVLAYVSLEEDHAIPELLSIPQLVAPDTVESLTQLPSFLYLLPESEDRNSYQVPGMPDHRFVIGEFARKQSAEKASRTVAAAKSWLTYSRVDRHEPILPWDAPKEVEKISPVEASRLYLEHLIFAWNQHFPEQNFADQKIVLTVPASFDASARELTREAALKAGFPDEFVLLEEPQAAVYAWLAHTGDRWRKRLKLGDSILICDVGGGTTDFTLIAVAEQQGDLILERRAVGSHVLVGGDNMDLALAHHMADEFAEHGHPLDPWQAVGLWHSCRAAKEKLFSTEAPETTPVTVLGRGRKLIANTVSRDLQREDARKLLLNGFFPECEISDQPQKRRRSGFQELGLPYESDTAITRHLAAFLNMHGEDAQPAQPTHVLFNGGVFKAQLLRDRLLETIHAWSGDAPTPEPLDGQEDLDHSVARGAAYYALTKQTQGVRIRGGTARSYYLGIEKAGLAVPGVERPLWALCVVPFGMEEGTEADVPSSEFGLVVGESTPFRFFCSAVRKQDQPGEVLDPIPPEELEETDPLQATLEAVDEADDDYVPVKFRSRITELGMFELWCVQPQTQQCWKLEFSVRDESQ